MGFLRSPSLNRQLRRVGCKGNFNHAGRSRDAVDTEGDE